MRATGYPLGVPLRDVAGHRRLVSLLSRAVARETLPPSLLFAGPRGVGKFTTAAALAQVINCTDPRSSKTLERDACGECPSCRRIARGVYSDVLTVAPGETGNIKIDQVRSVIDSAGYRPFEGRRRVVIIDEADAMVHEAQSAFLKTLEEPPSASIFILVSSVPDALMATVRSRCSRLRFGSLPEAEIADLLKSRHDYSDVDARAVAADAEGSIGRALSSQSADLVAAREDARHLLDQTARISDPARRLGLAKELTGKKKTLPEERHQLATCLHALGSILRDVAVLSVRGDERLLANPDLASALGPTAGAFDAARSARASKAVDRALGALERNVNPKVVANWLVLQL